jgi:hypothetical protein
MTQNSFLGRINMAKPAPQIDNAMDNIPYYEKWQLGEGIPIVKTFCPGFEEG